MSEVSQSPKSDDTATLSRRRFLQGGLAAAATAALALSPDSSEAATANLSPHDAPPAPPGVRRPNFLIILCDQMRFPPVYESEALKAFRDEHLLTQSFLRENGVEFTRHYTASSACSPSRTCILTGHYPSLHAVSQTYGGAKEACDPEVFWLDPNTVPTFGNYFRAAGYRTYWKGKWHVSDADMFVPGTHTPLLSFDPQTGDRDPDKEALYVGADRLGPYGFAGWIGPEPHGPNPLRDTGSSALTDNHGRDAGYAQQTVELIQELNRDPDATPWLVVSSFVNPHDIAVFSERTLESGAFDFHVDDDVPADEDLFVLEYDASHREDLTKKPKAQKSYAETYGVWGGPIPDAEGPHYRRFYYQLHKNLDEQMAKVMQALLDSRFKDDTIVVFASDHGEMLGSHGDLHQKMYQAYDETTRVPLFVWSRKLFKKPCTIETLTSHIDLAPTLLGLAGIDPEPIRQQLARNHSDARPMVGRDLSSLILGEVDPASVTEPVYLMIEDDPNRGPRMGDAQGITRPPVEGPKCIETVIARLADGTLWKYSRYFDSPQYWTSPAMQDVFLRQKQPTPAPEYDGHLDCEVAVKGTPVAEEFELYDLINDPMELDNKHNNPHYSSQQHHMEKLLAKQRKLKRLSPISGDVPGQEVNA
jgi:choline-sulfatase